MLLKRHDVGGVVLLAAGVAALAAVGCTTRPQVIGGMHPESGQVQPSRTGAMYTNAQDGISMPVPAGFSIQKLDDASAAGQIHVGSQGLRCQVILLFKPNLYDLDGFERGLEGKLNGDGHPTKRLADTQLGTLATRHVHVEYASGTTEEFYFGQYQSGILSMITVKGTTCTADFGPKVQGFRAG